MTTPSRNATRSTTRSKDAIWACLLLWCAIICAAPGSAFQNKHFMRPRQSSPPMKIRPTTIVEPSRRAILRRATKSTKSTGLFPLPSPAPGQKGKRAVYLTHERDFFRQVARLESMDSYVLVSTLTASMSFGALLGFTPSVASRAHIHLQAGAIKFLYRGLCLAIQIVSGLSAIFGLYATIMFALTILYGKSALGAERDREYDRFIRTTVRARVNGFRCFTWSLGLFALEALLVLAERTSFRWCSVPVCASAIFIMYHLYKDWTLLFRAAEIIYRD